MFSLPCHRSYAIDLATGIDEVQSVEKTAALVALVASCISLFTEWSRSLHESVRQELVVGFTEGLLVGVFGQELSGMEFREDVLGNLRVLLGSAYARRCRSLFRTTQMPRHGIL